MSNIEEKMTDQCIAYIQQRIKELGYESYEHFDAFGIGLTLGLETGIKFQKGEFDINNTKPLLNQKNTENADAENNENT